MESARAAKNRQNQCKSLLESRFSATKARVSYENSTKRFASTAFFRILLSCSLSRVQTQLFVSAAAEGAGSEERTAGDRTRRRRLNKLSCADWLPHDRGFVSGLPRSKDERRSGDRLITGQEGSPPRSCRRPCAPADLLLSTSLRCGRRVCSALERWLGDARDRPDKADHLTGDCSGDAAAHAYSLDKAMKMYARIRSLDQVAAMMRE